jgi:adenylate cyclase
VALCGLAAGLGTIAVGGELRFVDGPLFDFAVSARYALGGVGVGAGAEGAESPVAVVAVDSRSLASPELARYPRTLMAPVWSGLLETLFAAGARAVAFDLLFAYSANQFSPGHDRPFLRALSKHRDRLVIARTARTLPARPFMGALRFDPGALGLAELVPDADGVVRRVPARFPSEGGESVPGLAAAALERAGHGAMPDSVILGPKMPLERLPTYALIDVLGCAQEAGEALSRAFAGKVVLVGSTLAEEDRFLSPDRHLPREAGDQAPLHDCGLRRLGASAPHLATVPGVFLHAAAVGAVAQSALTALAPPLAVAALAMVVAFAGAALGLILRPWTAALALVILGLALWGAEVATLGRDLWLPVAAPLVALAAAAVIAVAARYLLEERQRRRVQNAFSHYLSPYIVDSLAESEFELKLGGEVRDVSIMFADLSGFTAASGTVPPEVLMRETNRYLALIVDEVEATGGYVDKFIGDAVMAIWGAPMGDPEHARSAVVTALRAAHRVALQREKAEAEGELGFGVKIGIASGEALVGNVGTEKRYNYTAVGETVNIAARLEGLPGTYAGSIVINQSTAERLGDDFLVYELDRVAVKGLSEGISVFEPLAPAPSASETQKAYAAGFGEALARYRARDFAGACAAWRALDCPYPIWSEGGAPGAGERPHPALVMAERAAAFAANPPPPAWDGVWVMTSK